MFEELDDSMILSQQRDSMKSYKLLFFLKKTNINSGFEN